MQIKDIKILVARLGAIVEGWDEQAGAPAVERHIAASLLAELYEAVKFDTALATTEVAKVEEIPSLAEESIAEPTEEDPVAEVIDLSDIFGGSFDDEAEPTEEVEEPVAEIVELPEVEVEAVPEDETEPEIEEEIEPEPEIEKEPVVIEEEQPTEPEEEPIIEEETSPIEESTPEVEVAPVVEEEVAPVVEETPAVEEETPAVDAESAPAVEEEKVPEVEEEKAASKQASLFDMEVVRRPRSSNSRRVIMSLYGESAPASQIEKAEKPEKVVAPAEPAPATNEVPAQESIELQKEERPIESATLAVSVAERLAAAQNENQPQILGEVIGAGTTTLAEAVAASQPIVQTVQNDRVNSLRNAIGINDRFILIRDLFGGDGAVYDRVIEQLDLFDDFNECLVYMSEYRWNPNSDGARLLMDLITRKLL